MIITLTTAEDAALRFEYTKAIVDQPSPPTFEVYVERLIRHQVFTPVIRRQRQYRHMTRIERLVKADDVVLAEVDAALSRVSADDVRGASVVISR